MRRSGQIIDDIERVRSGNNANWMALLRLALRAAPDEARVIVRAIAESDRKILDLMGELSRVE